MLNINPQYLVNHKDEKTAAVLSIQEHRLLMQHLEDLEDIFRHGCRSEKRNPLSGLP